MAKSDKTQLTLYIVDAFASKPFEGNPAAVCLLNFETNLDDTTMQSVAMEMNLLSAFIRPLRADDQAATGSRFGLRWFSPVQEIKLCGHATLASAAILFGQLGNQSKEITFETLSGDLIVKRDGEYLAMDFPLGFTEKKTEEDYKSVIESLDEIPGVQDVRWCPSLNDILIRLKDGWSRSDFEKWRCNVDQLQRSISGVFVVIVTTRGTSQQGYVDQEGTSYDFVSRCFAPWAGVPEDPVTGSAQTVLAHYWSQQLGKNQFYTRQCSPRAGEMRIQVNGDRVVLRGKAVCVMSGVLNI